MCRYVAIALLAVVVYNACAAPPLRVTIDCGSNESDVYRRPKIRPKSSDIHSHVESFCNLIHNAIPKAVNNGRFVLLQPDQDQIGFSDTQVPMSVAPPEGFISKLPRFKVGKLKVPKIHVPKLRPKTDSPFSAPRIGTPISFASLRSSDEEVSSAEKMEIFKKGVQKMLHAVKVLGQIDQYLSERTRIVIDKLSRTFAD